MKGDTHTCICIYLYVCVCMCVCGERETFLNKIILSVTIRKMTPGDLTLYLIEISLA